MFQIIALFAVLSGMFAAGAARAQPSSLFGDAPPRPPADIPNAALPPPPVQYPAKPAAPSWTPQQSSIQAVPLAPPSVPTAPAAGPNQGIGAQVPAAGVQTPRLAPLPPAANSPPGQPTDASAPPEDTVVTEMPSQKIENARAVFSGLDKITGRIISFDAAIGETVQFGALRVTARVCYTRPPTEATNTDAFVEVDEVTLQGEIKRVFTGWMFASSPGLHAVEHPIYDVWLTDCASPQPTRIAEPAAPAAPAAMPSATRAPAPSRSRQAAPTRRQPAPAAPAPVQPN